jgi:hypothetical protein
MRHLRISTGRIFLSVLEVVLELRRARK